MLPILLWIVESWKDTNLNSFVGAKIGSFGVLTTVCPDRCSLRCYGLPGRGNFRIHWPRRLVRLIHNAWDLLIWRDFSATPTCCNLFMDLSTYFSRLLFGHVCSPFFAGSRHQKLRSCGLFMCIFRWSKGAEAEASEAADSFPAEDSASASCLMGRLKDVGISPRVVEVGVGV